MQVAILVRRCHTNRGTGRVLGILMRTAASHVKHILAKLGLSDRLELATRVQGNSPIIGRTIIAVVSVGLCVKAS